MLGCSPPTFVLGEFAAPKSTMDTACCGSRPQSSIPTTVFTTNWMITEPPGDPVTAYSGPRPDAAWSNTRVGAMVLRGRLPGWTRLGTGTPSGPRGSAAKSVSWLLRMNPSTMWNEPNADSTVVVIEAALPLVSTMLIWLVPCSGGGGAGAVGGPNSPGFAVPMVR